MTGPMPRSISEQPILLQSMGMVALLMFVPAAFAHGLDDHRSAQAFFYTAILLLVVVTMLGIVAQARPRRYSPNGQLAALVGAYVVLPLIAAMPLAQIVSDTSWSNLWFEMLSSFTTTGATVYEAGRLPSSVHLWRAMVGWLGGFFVLMAAYAILGPMNLGGAEVTSGTSPGHGASGTGQMAGASGQGQRLADQTIRRQRAVQVILPVYAGLTFLLWLSLVLAGEDALLALTHAMGTLSTSGISAGAGMTVSGAGFVGEALILAFLLLALSRHLMPVHLPGIRRAHLREDPEIRLGLAIIGLVVLGLPLRHFLSEAGAFATFGEVAGAFWGTIFTATSFLTTTGYESYWWGSARNWAGMGAPGLLLMGLAIIGGGVATTSGGITLLRVYALFLQGRRELEKIIHPSSIGRGGAGARWLAGQGAYTAWIFFMLFTISVAVVVAALTLVGLDFERALIFGIAALTTTGQLANVAAESPLSYADLSLGAKLILGVTMIMGRLETLALIALLAPGNWRR